MITVAIDPGSNGGVCWHDSTTGKVDCIKMPATPEQVTNLILMLYKLHEGSHQLLLEQPPYYTGRNIPGSAVGKLMFNTGVLYGAAVATGFKTTLISPKAWQKEHPSLGAKAKQTTTQWKNRLKDHAQSLFKEIKVTLWNADALLILDLATRNLRKN